MQSSGVQRGIERVQAATQEASRALKVVVAEQCRLNAGETTLLTLNLQERFLAEAQVRLLKARARTLRTRL